MLCRCRVRAPERADDDAELDGDVSPATLDRVGRAEWALPVADLLLRLGASGRLISPSSLWFCQKQKPNATATTASETNSRVRSSSR